jgi:hypothetical protein
VIVVLLEDLPDGAATSPPLKPDATMIVELSKGDKLLTDVVETSVEDGAGEPDELT